MDNFVTPASAEDFTPGQRFVKKLLETAINSSAQGFAIQGLQAPDFFLIGVCEDMVMPASLKEIPAEDLMRAGQVLQEIAKTRLTEEKPWL